MVKIMKGDLFESCCPVLVNAVNCVGIMGGGIAKGFADRFPKMLKDYRQVCRDGNLVPGGVHIWDDGGDIVVLNAATMFYPGEDANLAIISECCDNIVKFAQQDGDNRPLAIPALGCGVGGADWNVVRPLMENVLGQIAQDVLLYAPVPFMRRVMREATR